MLLEGKDPVVARKIQKTEAGNTFRAIGTDWHAWKSKRLSSKYAIQVMRRLKLDVFPEIGETNVDEISAPDILKMIRKIEDRGAYEMARKAKMYCSQIFRYAIVNGKCSRDPAADLRGALLPAPPVQHSAVVQKHELPQLLRDIDNYDEIGEPTTRLGLQLTMLSLLRTSEIINAEWSQIKGLETDEPCWLVPDQQMKMKGRDGHIVPLSHQAVVHLKELQKITGKGKLILPGEKPGKPISNNTLLYALYRMGYRRRQTTHGFRRIASTVLNDAGFRADVIEKQLAHEEKNEVRRAYNAAEYMSERRSMLQWFADFLDALKTDAPIPTVPRQALVPALQ